MSNLEMKQLAKVAKELNEVMDLDPKIKTVAVSQSSLEKAIIINAAEIHWKAGVDEDGDQYEADELSEETIDVLNILGCGNPDSKKSAKKSKHQEIEDAENDEPVRKSRADKKAEVEEEEEDEDEEEPIKKSVKVPDVKEKKTTPTKEKAPIKKEKAEKISRAEVFAPILQATAKKPASIDEMAEAMYKGFGGSITEAKYQTKNLLSYLGALGLIETKNDKIKFIG